MSHSGLGFFAMLKITIQTGDDPLETRDFYNIFTAYPLAQNGYCTSTDERLEQIWDVSWRITRLCALETYMIVLITSRFNILKIHESNLSFRCTWKVMIVSQEMQ